MPILLVDRLVMKQLALGFDRLSRKHLYYAACVGVLVAAAVLRFHNLSETSLWLDEAIAANNSRGTFWEVALYTRHRNSSPVFYPYLLWAVQLVESSPFSVRFVPALASTLTVGVFLFVLPNVGVGRTASLIAGLLAGLSPAAIEEARGVREYGVDALVALLLIVGVLIYLTDRKKKLPLCATLIVAPTLQYGLALFAVAAIATAMTGVLWTEVRLDARTDFSDRLRTALRLTGDMLWPCASFAVGCAIALVTLSGQWKGSGWYAPSAETSGYFQGEFYELLRIVDFVSTQTWAMIEYHIGLVAPLVLLSLAILLFRIVRRPQFDAIPMIFLVSVTIAALAAILNVYPLGGIRQNTFLGPVVFLVSGFALSSVIFRFPSHPARHWLTAITIATIALSGIYSLDQADPYRARTEVKQAIDILEEQRRAGDSVYVGGYAAPVVQFYEGKVGAGKHYSYGRCLGPYFQTRLDECAADLRDKIMVLDYSGAAANGREAKLYLLFHNEVPGDALIDAFGEFYKDDVELMPVYGGLLHAVANFSQIAPNVTSPIDGESRVGNLIISDEYNVYVNGRELTYVNRECSPYDTAATFFLDLIPKRESAGAETFEFSFEENGTRLGRTCKTTYLMPEYDVMRIRTGQHVRLKMLRFRVWESAWQDIQPHSNRSGF